LELKNLFVQGEQITLETYLNKKGIDNYRKYLKPPTSVLDDCYIYDNIHEAVNEIKYHILENHRFCLVIDGDCDGYTSAYVMYKYIKLQNPKCKVHMIVQDGKIRGLDSAFIRNKIIEYEPDCLILTDSGTNSAPYEQMLSDCHIPLTVIDHHDSTEDICKHSIVVNNRLNNLECNTELSGCGVTFKVTQALDKEFGTKYSNRFIDLVGISIISDSMDVRTYENRWFVKYILDDKEHIENPFMYELFDRFLGDTYTQRDISFRIVPLINSVIRCGTTEDKQQLFLAFDGKKIDETIEMCTHYHQEQVQKRDKFIEHHQEEIDEQADSNITIIDAKDIPQNFSGLIAGKISGDTNKPCIVGKTTDGELGGSFRGYIPISIMKDLPSVVFAQGHEIGAYGIRLKTQNLDDFRAEIDKMDISIDKEVVASYSANKLQMGIFDEFVGHEDLWGKELDKPMFYVYNIRVNSHDIKVLGDKQNTLKIDLADYTIMFFKMTEQRINEFGINFGEIVDDKTKKREVLYSNQDLSIDVIGTLDINVYENKYTHRITRTNQIIVDDFEIKVIENSFEDLM
jgi:single-stranded-DNA-specific exonuclease